MEKTPAISKEANVRTEFFANNTTYVVDASVIPSYTSSHVQDGYQIEYKDIYRVIEDRWEPVLLAEFRGDHLSDEEESRLEIQVAETFESTLDYDFAPDPWDDDPLSGFQQGDHDGYDDYSYPDESEIEYDEVPF